MYIRRKVFSTVIDENGEERYFSINEIIDEENYLNEVMYSKKNNEPRKLSTDERKALADYLKAGKRVRKDNELLYEGDEEPDKKTRRKLRNKLALRDAKHEGIKGAAAGGVLGAGIGALVGKGKGAAVGGATGAALLGGLDAIASGTGSRAGLALRDKLSRKNKSYKKALEQERDLYRVSEGKMNINTYKKRYRDE